MQVEKLASIEDLRLIARRRVPKIVFDYIDGGADTEITLVANRAAFDKIEFSPRCAGALQKCNLQRSVLGTTLSLPLLLAPIGYSSVLCPMGELVAARAAAKAGVGYVLSTVSGQRLEDVHDCCRGRTWYQLYMWGGRTAAEAAVERAARSGIAALVLTVDGTVAGKRERDIRNGVVQLFTGSVWSKLPFLGQLVTRPRWLLNYVQSGGMPKLANVVLPEVGPLPLTGMPFFPVTWEDVRWVRALWKGPLVIKGVLTADDARRCLDAGANAIVVSNHGGRQLDGVPASLQALSAVIDAVQNKAEILIDGGIRRGSDVVKALCMGARAVLCGRAFAYGLAAAGEKGVTCALRILREDIERTLLLLGCSSLEDLSASYICNK